MRHANRKASKEEMARATSVIREAFPDLDVVWGSHSTYGGHRAPRDHTISFRLREPTGKYRSNVVWLMPQSLSSLTVQCARSLVARANGRKSSKRK